LGGTAKITGDISYSEMSMEKGAIINGQLISLQDEGKKVSKTADKEKDKEEK
jgi:cytoskeletal protein CcmA (bactofilin family)